MSGETPNDSANDADFDDGGWKTRVTNAGEAVTNGEISGDIRS
jgi:hypothetical protein